MIVELSIHVIRARWIPFSARHLVLVYRSLLGIEEGVIGIPSYCVLCKSDFKFKVWYQRDVVWLIEKIHLFGDHSIY